MLLNRNLQTAVNIIVVFLVMGSLALGAVMFIPSKSPLGTVIGKMASDPKLLSAIMAFEYGGWFGLYNSGYDPDYEYLSVGLLLKALAIEFAINTGKTCYDFLQGSERYKYDLGGKDTQVCYVQCTRH